MAAVVLQVRHQNGQYPIHIAAGLLSATGERLRDLFSARRVCVVTDDCVAKNFLVPLMKSLEAAEFSACPPIILPAGEGAKNFNTLEMVIDRCSGYKLDRKSVLIALGGGVVGDLTGFAAAIYMRGISFVQIPTTLLAQVDSSVGGKTGINIPAGKNLVGAFHQPEMVLIDPKMLATLPSREMRAGYAEVLKYALIGDADFFEWLEQHGKGVLSGDLEKQQEAIAKSCQAKAAIVAADEKEQNDIRALLNLGHSFGHALEALGCYDGRLLHGEAVGIGISLAFELSQRLGACPESDVRRVQDHLDRAGLTRQPPFAATAGDVLDRMRGDKKNRDGHIALILAKGIGRAFVEKNVSENLLMDFLKERFGG